MKHKRQERTTPQELRFCGGVIRDNTVLVFHGLPTLASQQRAVLRESGDQSPPGRGALLGVMAEGDAFATAASPGNTLKRAVPVPSAEPSAAVLAGDGS